MARLVRRGLHIARAKRAIFPASEPAGDGPKHGRTGRGLFSGYAGLQIWLSRVMQIPVALLCVLVTLPAYYTIPASAVGVQEALSSLHVSFDLLHADYQAAFLRTVNLEPWKEPVGIVDIDDGVSMGSLMTAMSMGAVRRLCAD